MTRHAPVIDPHGVTHRPGCTLPGWSSDSPRIAGVHVLRCSSCGAVRLTRPGSTT